jgi:hypothetical protein
MRRWLLVALSVALAVSVFAPVAAAQGDDGSEHNLRAAESGLRVRDHK